MKAIEIKQLSVVYPGHQFYQPATQVLKNLSFEVKKGEVLGIIGPNGAGKTTLIKAILGFIFPASGEIRIFGHLMPEPKLYQKIGYLSEHPSFYSYLTAQELLTYYAKLSNLPPNKTEKRIQEVLEQVGLGAVASNKRLGHYSKGMLQRFGLAQAILHDPPLLILDEPMSGLDPMGRHDISLLIQSLNREGKTIVFVSHILHDVETLSDRVCIMKEGRLVKITDMDSMLSSTISGIQVVLKKRVGLREQIKEHVLSCAQSGDRWIVLVADYQKLNRVVEIAQKNQANILGIDILRDSLEDYFVKTVQEGKENE